jgi:glucosamine-phosphate N-acetyltransferase
MPPTIRLLEAPDFDNGFLATLANLSPVGLTPAEAERIWHLRKQAGVHTIVAEADGRIIGTASLILEQKFIHQGGSVGHIEDVAVHPDAGGHGIGSALVDHLTGLARERGCYKVILSCLDRLVPFYERLGFRRHDSGMRIDLKAV